jgi:hypothetical protein
LRGGSRECQFSERESVQLPRASHDYSQTVGGLIPLARQYIERQAKVALLDGPRFSGAGVSAGGSTVG